MSPPRGRPINELFRYPVRRKRANAVLTLGGLLNPTPQVGFNLTRRVWRKSALVKFRWRMVNVNGPTVRAGPLISHWNLLRSVNNQRVKTRRGAGRRPMGAGGVGVGAPNSRSKNDGPEE